MRQLPWTTFLLGLLLSWGLMGLATVAALTTKLNEPKVWPCFDAYTHKPSPADCDRAAHPSVSQESQP
jgi:hypothetical protein